MSRGRGRGRRRLPAKQGAHEQGEGQREKKTPC